MQIKPLTHFVENMASHFTNEIRKAYIKSPILAIAFPLLFVSACIASYCFLSKRKINPKPTLDSLTFLFPINDKPINFCKVLENLSQGAEGYLEDLILDTIEVYPGPNSEELSKKRINRIKTQLVENAQRFPGHEDLFQQIKDLNESDALKKMASWTSDFNILMFCKEAMFFNGDTIRVFPYFKKELSFFFISLETQANYCREWLTKYADQTDMLSLTVETRLLLTELPKEIGFFKNLKTLSIEKQKIKLFPRALSQCENLKSLFLRENEIERLPKEIGSLKNLTSFSMDGNRLNSLPKELKNCSLLRHVSLINNQFITFPKEICDCHLTTLKMAQNKISSIPDEIGKMIYLKGLDLSSNYLTSISTKIQFIGNNDGGEMTLNLNNNELKDIPSEIGQIRHIKYLRLENNQLTELPDAIDAKGSIFWLDLQRNPITTLPNGMNPRHNLHIVTCENQVKLKKDLENRGFINPVRPEPASRA